MKKILFLALVLCTVLGAGVLVAGESTEAVEADLSVELVDVLPQTVLEEVTAEAFELCPRPDVYCLDVWDPVTCSNGVTYSNACYAYRACATGCTSGGAQS